MCHYFEIDDENGDLVELIPFCSDACHQEGCRLRNLPYAGWNGAHEGGDGNEWCRTCGVIAHCGEEACECQQGNVVVNRFTTEEGETCEEHGNWIQLPRRMLSEDE